MTSESPGSSASAGRRLVVEADGGSRGNPGPAGYGALVRDAESGEVLREVAGGIGTATNNVAEYQGLIAGLRAAVELAPAAVEVRMDSKLVVEQMSGRWQVKHPDMRRLRVEAGDLVRQLRQVRFVHIPRARNAHADRLANEAMDAAARGLPWAPPAARVDAAAEVPEPEPEPAERFGRLPGWSPEQRPPSVMLLLRHGETPHSVERRFSGAGGADPGLTERGAAQAAAAAERLRSADIEAIVTSPLRRTRETAAAVAEVLALEPAVEDGFAETAFGAWDGHTFAEVGERWPAELAEWLADPEVAPPGGESLAATARRVRRARDRVLAANPGRRVLVVTHVTPIKSVVRFALEAPVSSLYRIHLDPACLTEVLWYADGAAVLRSLNDTCHLGEARSGKDM